jgi:alpha-mannosidase
MFKYIITYVVEFLVFLLAPSLLVVAQQSKNAIVINVIEKNKSESREILLNGYRTSISGQVLGYHSSHPDADQALLSRANKEAHSIVWETDTLAGATPDEFYHFIWLAGLERSGWGESKTGHRFDLLINGKQWFTFKNFKDSTDRDWHVSGKDGSELSFKAQMADRFGDLFGYMFMKLPKKDFTPGRALQLQVNGDNGDSPEWYMTFQYHFNFTPRLRVEPALMRDKDHINQVVRLSLDNLQNGRSIEIHTSTDSVISESLKVGANIFLLPIRQVKADLPLSVSFQINGTEKNRSTVTVSPVTPREVYLIPHSHNDIGYTDLQPNVEKKQWDNIKEALRLIIKTRDYPPEASYKWNVEILWPFISYLEKSTPAQRDTLRQAIVSDALGLNAFAVNPLTGLATAAEMNHFFDNARGILFGFKYPIITACVSDIPGFTWGIVTALAQNGVRYFASAPNAGDRIGNILQAWGDKPFYWVSQSGKERVLFWVAGASYSSFHEGTLKNLGSEKIMKLMRKLDENKYPYDMYYLPYTLGDNGGNDSTLSDFVKDWNERYVSPKLIIATHRQMFTEFERRYGSSLQSIEGDLTPYWEDGAASTAYETALNRQAVDRLLQGEALWGIRSSQTFPATEYYSAWRNAVLFDEHTWGADKSITNPDDPSVKEQWRIKRQFACDADSLSKVLLIRALDPPKKKKGGKTAFDIYNTSSWTRTDLILLSKQESSIGDRVLDEKGNLLASQRLSTGELAVFVKDVLPFSAKRIFLTKGKAPSRGTAKAYSDTLENSTLMLTIDRRTGAIDHLIWKKTHQLVDSLTGKGLNEYFYVHGKDPDSAQHPSNVRIKVKEKGRLLASLVVEADAPGCKRYRTEIRLIDGLDRVDIIDELDKRAIREKEAVHIAFPFNVSGSEVRYDVAGAIVRPGMDQLDGSCKNFFPVQSWVDVSHDGFGVTWATPDAPMIEIGAITAELRWMNTIEPKPLIYSYIMNNYWHTNYKADQGGVVKFRYSIYPHESYKPEEAVRIGLECRQPLIVTATDSRKETITPLFILNSSALIASLRLQTTGNMWLLTLYNPTAQTQSASIDWKRVQPLRLNYSDNYGSTLRPVSGEIVLTAYETRVVRIDGKQ